MQFNKVEISSVRTSELKVLSEKECKDLLIKAQKGDKIARDEIIKGNLRLVLSVVQRFRYRDSSLDDLFQVGCIGLIKACDNFNVNLNVRFSTYAVPMIIGEIKRYLRDNTSVRVSRSLRDTAYHAMQVKEKFINENGREPDASEIADLLNVSRREVIVALEAIVEPMSLYEPLYSDSADSVYVVDQLGDISTEQSLIEELNIKEAIKNLDSREKLILHKRFMMGHTQTEVASEIGISQAQVSRIEKSAMEKIKS